MPCFQRAFHKQTNKRNDSTKQDTNRWQVNRKQIFFTKTHAIRLRSCNSIVPESKNLKCSQIKKIYPPLNSNTRMKAGAYNQDVMNNRYCSNSSLNTDPA